MDCIKYLTEFISEVTRTEKKLTYTYSYIRIISPASARIDNILLQMRAIPGVVVVSQRNQVRMSDIVSRAIDVVVKSYKGTMSEDKFNQFLKDETIRIKNVNSVILKTKQEVEGGKSKEEKKYDPIQRIATPKKRVETLPSTKNEPEKKQVIVKGL
jgi:hypothetical protein